MNGFQPIDDLINKNHSSREENTGREKINIKQRKGRMEVQGLKTIAGVEC